MSRELIFTSAPRGVRSGSQGFCTVAHTQGMPTNLIQQLESLSAYRHIFSPQELKASLNPVVFSHLTLGVGGRRYHVLSRICDAGLDYTQRTNKFAHHVVLDATEVPAAGPAWLLGQSGFMQRQWAGEPMIRATGPMVPAGNSRPRVCRVWQQVTGDAGWAGALAETAAEAASRQAVLVFQPGMDMLSLLDETMALLPADLRWRVTFSTYFTKLPAGVVCQWRCVVDGTPEAVAARRAPQGAVVLDLCRSLGQAAESPYVEAARTGKGPAVKAASGPLSDVELRRALQKTGRSPVHAGVESPPFSGNTVGYGVPPPTVSTPWHPPLGRQQFIPKRKPSPKWPWVLAIAAVVVLLVAAGLTVWTAYRGGTPSPLASGTDTPNISAVGQQGQQETSKVGHPSADKPPTGAQTGLNKDAAGKPSPNAGPAAIGPPTAKGSTGTEDKLPPMTEGIAPENTQKTPATGGQQRSRAEPLPTARTAEPSPTTKSIHEDVSKKPRQDAKAPSPKMAEAGKSTARVKQWLESLPSAVQIPEPLRGPSKKDEDKSTLLKEGDWSLPEPCKVRLVGGDDAFVAGAKWGLHQDKSDLPRWSCDVVRPILGGERDQKAVAELRFQEKGLSFRWLDRNPPDIAPAQLMNCLLEFTAVNETARYVALRSARTVDTPFVLKLLNKDDRLQSKSHTPDLLMPCLSGQLRIQLLGIYSKSDSPCWAEPNQERDALDVYSVEPEQARVNPSRDADRLFLELRGKAEAIEFKGGKARVKITVEPSIHSPAWLDEASTTEYVGGSTPRKEKSGKSRPADLSCLKTAKDRFTKDIRDPKQTGDGAKGTGNEQTRLARLQRNVSKIESFLKTVNKLFDEKENAELCYCVYRQVAGQRVDLLIRDPRQADQQGLK